MGVSVIREYALGLVLLVVFALTIEPESSAAADAVAVTLFDGNFNPYTAWGMADTSGQVVVFDHDPRRALAPAGAAAATFTAGVLPPYQGAGLRLAVGAPSLATPIETSARPVTPVSEAPETPPPGSPPVHDPAETATEPRYKDGVYVVNPDYILDYPRNVGRILTSPARFDGDDWFNVAMVAGITGGLIVLDKELLDAWRSDVHGDTAGTMAEVFRPLGDSRYIVTASLGLYALAEMLDSSGQVNLKREKSATLLALESFLLAQGFVTGLKFVTGRERPDAADNAFQFEGPAKADFNSSFPSGHATSAFAVAAVLAETYGPDNPWVPWVAYTGALGTALARVEDDRHWFSDVFFGGAVGLFIGQMVVRLSPFLERNDMALTPFGNDDAQGVALSMKF